MHTQEGIKEKFVGDLSDVTEELLKQGNKKLDGRVWDFCIQIYLEVSSALDLVGWL